MKHLRLTAGALLVSTALSSVAHAATELAMWYHGAGNEVESAIVNQIIDDFNASQSEYTIALESFPQGAYNDAVQAAALAGNLPDIIDVDGPVMPGWAWAGYIAPLPIDDPNLPISYLVPKGSGMAQCIPSVCGMRRLRFMHVNPL